MKFVKNARVLSVIILACILTACASGEVSKDSMVNEIAAGEETETLEAEATPTPVIFDTEATPTPEAEEPVSLEADPSVDYDLTVMGSDMVYATVYQLMVDPSEYEGKTFKVSGTYDELTYPETGVTYHFVVIADAMAGCSQGLEFIWEDENKEYPQVGHEVTCKGTFETYKEEGEEGLFCHLNKCS